MLRGLLPASLVLLEPLQAPELLPVKLPIRLVALDIGARLDSFLAHNAQVEPILGTQQLANHVNLERQLQGKLALLSAIFAPSEQLLMWLEVTLALPVPQALSALLPVAECAKNALEALIRTGPGNENVSPVPLEALLMKKDKLFVTDVLLELLLTRMGLFVRTSPSLVLQDPTLLVT